MTLPSFAALALWLLGYPDQALKRDNEALTLAQELSHPHSLAWPLAFTASFYEFRREGQAVREQADAADYTLDRARVSATISDGKYLAGLGTSRAKTREEEGITEIRQGSGRLPATGAENTADVLLGS